VHATQAGTVAPSLVGVGARLTRTQLRERLIAPERFNPQTVMPSYGRAEGFNRVASARRSQPLLDSQQIEDVVEWMSTLK
jgi:L-cysteine S-thiosulfotransferase